MEWLVLVVWILIVALSLPLSTGVIAGNGWLGVQALAALAGLALTVVYIAGGGNSLIWVSLGAAALGLLAVALAATSLMSPVTSSAGQTADEVHAILAGSVVPLFMSVGFLGLLLALGIAHVGTL